MRILLFVDAFRAKNTERDLVLSGYEVEATSDEGEALRKLQENPPDLLLTEVHLPKFDSRHLIKSIRTDPRFANLKIIVMIWARKNDFPGEEANGFMGEPERWGVDCFIRTPFKIDTLIQITNDIAAQKPLDKALY